MSFILERKVVMQGLHLCSSADNCGVKLLLHKVDFKLQKDATWPIPIDVHILF